MKLEQLLILNSEQLCQFAESLGIKNAGLLTRKETIIKSLMILTEHEQEIECSGYLEVMPEGYGFLRIPINNFVYNDDDVYVSPNQIKKFRLRSGDHIIGLMRVPKEKEKWFSLLMVSKINGQDVESRVEPTPFESLTPIHVTKQLVLEQQNTQPKPEQNNYIPQITPRLIDFLTPIGLGQRALVVAPPKAGKTELLKNIAFSISHNYPDVKIIVLLIDERPEEVTDMARTVNAEVTASTFDEPATRHVQVAEMVIDRAKRMVENKKDVVILLDSITRLVRAYNSVTPPSGKVLSGGIDANALHRPKRFFGAARNLEEGGSLTIIATALINTGSKMDEVIYEEFKGTGNMELHLNRRLAQRRIFPAIDILESSTRKEELMLSTEALDVQWEIRKFFDELGSEISAISYLIDAIKSTPSNQEMLKYIKDDLSENLERQSNKYKNML